MKKQSLTIIIYRKRKVANKINHSYKQLDNEGIIAQNTATFPVNEERFSISKNTVSEDVKIEKRWITTTKKVEIPVSYEEVYVNDKVIKLSDEKYDDGILTKLKDKILNSIDKDENNSNNQETEKVIPTLGEEIVISRRTVKIGEIAIKKREELLTITKSR